MKLAVKTLDNVDVGDIEVRDDIFALEPRQDVLHRVVRWQLSKRQAGTHKTKERSDVSGSTQKAFKQKGTGRARRGSGKAVQFRGGGVTFGPRVRSHAHGLPKKIRRLGLCSALSSKQSAGQLIVLDTVILQDPKTKTLRSRLSDLGLTNALLIDGNHMDTNFVLASRNVPNFDILPAQGANVYDILRRKTLVLTKAAIEALEARL